MDSAPTIPIVDLSPFINREEKFSNSSAVRHIGHALEKIGFVYLINHGIPVEKVKRAFLESQRFFELESDVKAKYKKDMAKGIKGYHGYSSPTTDLPDQAASELRESYDLNPRVSSTKFPGEEAPNLGPALKDLEAEFRSLIMTLLKLIENYLELPENSSLTNCVKSVLDPTRWPSFNSLRCNYYPAISENVRLTPGTVRCSQHTDWGLFTLLFQDSVGGLEVKSNDVWVQAEPVDGAILMNTGDMLEIMSGERFPATFHRILIPEKEIQKRTARQSVLFFLFPDDETPIVSLVGQTDQSKCMTALEYTQNRSQRLFY